MGGAIVLTAGLVYLLVVLPNVSTSGAGVDKPDEVFVLHVNYIYALHPQATVDLGWSAQSAIRLAVEACGTDALCRGENLNIVAYGNGTSGNLTFLATEGKYYGVLTSAPLNLSYRCSTPLPFFYLALPDLMVGLALIAWSVRWSTFRKGFDPKSHPEVPVALTSSERRALLPLIRLIRAQRIVLDYPCPECKSVSHLTKDSALVDLAACRACKEPFDRDVLLQLLVHSRS